MRRNYENRLKHFQNLMISDQTKEETERKEREEKKMFEEKRKEEIKRASENMRQMLINKKINLI